jgi:ribosomal protein S17
VLETVTDAVVVKELPPLSETRKYRVIEKDGQDLKPL